MSKLFKRTIIEAENSDLNLNEIVGGIDPTCPCNNNPLGYSEPPCIQDCACLTILISCPCNKDHGVCNAYINPCGFPAYKS